MFADVLGANTALAFCPAPFLLNKYNYLLLRTVSPLLFSSSIFVQKGQQKERFQTPRSTYSYLLGFSSTHILRIHKYICNNLPTRETTYTHTEKFVFVIICALSLLYRMFIEFYLSSFRYLTSINILSALSLHLQIPNSVFEYFMNIIFNSYRHTCTKLYNERCRD